MSHTTSQQRFTARIRDPQQVLPPGIATERMAIYEELFFNNLDGFISGGFPALRRSLDEPRWHRLVHAFIREHRRRIPCFSQLGEEFIGWLQDGYRAREGDSPFLLELAHYEWVELALSPAEAPVETLPQAWLWSPLAWPLAYRWPVHRLRPSHRSVEPPVEPTCLLVWRDLTERVRFLHLSPFAYRLAQRLSEEGETSVTLLPLLCGLTGSCGLSVDAEYLENAFALLEDWHAQGILTGGGALE